jgi:solute carrier family 25 phosphate transporter 23/24/25/41
MAAQVHAIHEKSQNVSVQFEEERPLNLYQIHRKAAKTAESKLTQYLPEPGYFLAGAISGGVSRTATAPLDRLKVYLLVSTKSTANLALDAAKHGHPCQPSEMPAGQSAMLS